MPFDAILILAIVVLDAILGYLPGGARRGGGVGAAADGVSHGREASLTGESEPVLKDPVPVAEEAALGDRLNTAFNGTAVTRGRRVMVSGATAWHRDGRVARLFGRTESEQTPRHRE